MQWVSTKQKMVRRKTNHQSHSIKRRGYLSRENVCTPCKFVFCTKTNAVIYTTSQLANSNFPCYSNGTKGDTEKRMIPRTRLENFKNAIARTKSKLG